MRPDSERLKDRVYIHIPARPLGEIKSVVVVSLSEIYRRRERERER